MKIVGFERKKGKFNGSEYDNMVLHVLTPFPTTSEAEGSMTDTVKIKTAEFDLYEVDIGDVISVTYNKFGKITEIRKE